MMKRNLNQIYTFSFETRVQKLIITLLSLLMVLLIFKFFLVKYYSTITIIDLLIFFLAMILILLIHEICHATAALFFKIKFKFGLKSFWLAYCELKQPFDFKKGVIIGLAPFIIVNVLILTGITLSFNHLVKDSLWVLLLVHSVSCYGDFCYVWVFIKFKDKVFIDSGIHLEVYRRENIEE